MCVCEGTFIHSNTAPVFSRHLSMSQVSVPKDLVAVMSAVRDGQEVDSQDNNRTIYRFRQPVRVVCCCYVPEPAHGRHT